MYLNAIKTRFNGIDCGIGKIIHNPVDISLGHGSGFRTIHHLAAITAV